MLEVGREPRIGNRMTDMVSNEAPQTKPVTAPKGTNRWGLAGRSGADGCGPPSSDEVNMRHTLRQCAVFISIISKSARQRFVLFLIETHIRERRCRCAAMNELRATPELRAATANWTRAMSASVGRQMLFQRQTRLLRFHACLV